MPATISIGGEGIGKLPAEVFADKIAAFTLKGNALVVNAKKFKNILILTCVFSALSISAVLFLDALAQNQAEEVDETPNLSSKQECMGKWILIKNIGASDKSLPFIAIGCNDKLPPNMPEFWIRIIQVSPETVDSAWKIILANKYRLRISLDFGTFSFSLSNQNSIEQAIELDTKPSVEVIKDLLNFLEEDKVGALREVLGRLGEGD